MSSSHLIIFTVYSHQFGLRERVDFDECNTKAETVGYSPVNLVARNSTNSCRTQIQTCPSETNVVFNTRLSLSQVETISVLRTSDQFRAQTIPYILDSKTSLKQCEIYKYQIHE